MGTSGRTRHDEARPGVFISYRRNDSAGQAGRLYDRLVHRFGADRVFMDVDSLDPGADFAETIERELWSAAVVLAVIGPDWTGPGRSEPPRLHDPNDLVRIEIETALRREVPVVPLLVRGGRMPSTDELPPTLHPLCRRHAMSLDDARFDRDARTVIEALGRYLPPPAEGGEEPGTGVEPRPRDGNRGGLRTGLLVAGAGFVAFWTVAVAVWMIGAAVVGIEFGEAHEGVDVLGFMAGLFAAFGAGWYTLRRMKQR